MGGEFGPPVSLPPRALCSTSAAVPLPGGTSSSAQERQLSLPCSVLLLVLPTYLVPRAPLCYILLSLGLSSPSFLAVLLSLLQSSPAIADIIIMDASSSCALFSSSKVGIPCHRARECHEPQGFILVSLGPICISLCRATIFDYADELVRRT